MSENLAFAKALYMLTKTVESNGGSLSWARSLPTLLQDAGLMDVDAEIDRLFPWWLSLCVLLGPLVSGVAR